MFLQLRGTDGLVIVNSDEIEHIASAADEHKRPMLGYCAIVFKSGRVVALRYTVDELGTLLGLNRIVGCTAGGDALNDS